MKENMCRDRIELVVGRNGKDPHQARVVDIRIWFLATSGV